MYRYILGGIIVCLFAVGAVALGAPVQAKSSVESVTLYRGQAMVTRVVDVPADEGDLQLLVGPLPSQAVGQSLSASGADATTVQSVRYRVRAVAEAPQKAVAELDGRIKAASRDLAANRQHLALLAAKAGYVDKLQDFSTTMAKVDLSQGKMDAKGLQSVTEQVFALRTKLTAERIALDLAAEDIQEKLSLLQRRRKELVGKTGRQIREAVVFLNKSRPGATQIRLRYMVNAAGWSPTYNVRLADDGKTVRVEYLAQIVQVSGEDWDRVKLTLSTATPAINARGPLLTPMWLALSGRKGKASSAALAKQVSSTANSQYGLLGQWAANPYENTDYNWKLNRNAAIWQTIEFNAEADSLGGYLAAASQEGLAVTYDLTGKMSLASRQDQQLIRIADLDLGAEVYYLAIPLLSSYVYRAAEIHNTTNLPLLAGPYASYIRGQFKGRGQLRLMARGQKVAVGFGVDEQLRCSRVLERKTDRVSWGSRVQTFHYRLRLENYKDAPVSLRLYDRIPATRNENITIEMAKTSQALSTDAVYVRDDRPAGILRWEVAVPARAADATAHDLRYSFQMKYAKDMHIGHEATGDEKEMLRENVRRMMFH